MNSYERYMAMVCGRSVDHVPRIPILMHFAARYINATYDQFARDPQVMVQANCKLVEDFGFEQLDIMSDPWRETAGFGAQLEYLPHTVPRCVRHPLQDSKNLALLPDPDPLVCERMANAIKVIEGYRVYGYHRYSITGWVEGPAAEAADLRGVTPFLMDLVDDPPFCCELMDICTAVAIRYAFAQLDAGADTIGVGDAISSQISPQMFEDFVAVRHLRLVEAIHAHGGLARLHICGDISNLLPVIANLGYDIVDCDWMVDMRVAREQLGSNTALAGNLDPVNSVMKSTPERIQAEFAAIYQQVGNPWFVTAGCEIPQDTPMDNLRALCTPIPAC